MEIFRQVTANNIELKEYPFWKELAMEAYLLENEDILKLDKQNFNDVTIIDAEIALTKGSKENGGRIDILAKYSGEYLAIVELKLNEIADTTLLQLENYIDQKEQILKFKNYWQEEASPKWIGVLIGSSISPSLQEKLLNAYEYKGVPIAGMTIRRFKSDKNEVFVISDTYFKFKYSSKDFSKFIFNGQEYNKGKLVNAVLKYYVDINTNISFAELKEIFPNKIQGSNLGVFDTLARAEEIYQKWGHKRYYIKPDETIVYSGQSNPIVSAQTDPPRLWVATTQS